MILDTLPNAHLYSGAHPGLRAAFDWLAKTDLAHLPDGKYEIDGKRLYAMSSKGAGKGREGRRLEVHQKYIDIQIAVSGSEVIGWRTMKECSHPAGAFDVQKDAGFYTDPSALWLPLPAGTFTVLFPEDAHAPGAGEGEVQKIVMKVAVDWK
jgi:biofilm protein TabA